MFGYHSILKSITFQEFNMPDAGSISSKICWRHLVAKIHDYGSDLTLANPPSMWYGIDKQSVSAVVVQD